MPYNGDPRNLSAGRTIGKSRGSLPPRQHRYIGVGRLDNEPVEEEYEDPVTGEIKTRWRVGPSYERYVAVPRESEISDQRAVEIARASQGGQGGQEGSFLDGLRRMFGMGGAAGGSQEEISTAQLPGGTPIRRLTGGEIGEAEAERLRQEEMERELAERRRLFGRELAEDNMRFGQKMAQQRSAAGLKAQLAEEERQRARERRQTILESLGVPLSPEGAAAFLEPAVGDALQADQAFAQQAREEQLDDLRARAERLRLEREIGAVSAAPSPEVQRRVEQIERVLENLPAGSEAALDLLKERERLLDPERSEELTRSVDEAFDRVRRPRQLEDVTQRQGQLQEVFSQMSTDPRFARAVKDFEDAAYKAVTGQRIERDDYMLPILDAAMAVQRKYGEGVSTQDIIDYLERRVTGTKPGFGAHPIQALGATVLPESLEPFDEKVGALMREVRKRFPVVE